MIKLIATFLFLTVAIGLGIQLFRQLSGSERWQLTKTLAYSTMCSLVAVILMVAMVILF
jgi:hypothetical protein